MIFRSHPQLKIPSIFPQAARNRERTRKVTARLLTYTRIEQIGLSIAKHRNALVLYKGDDERVHSFDVDTSVDVLEKEKERLVVEKKGFFLDALQ